MKLQTRQFGEIEINEEKEILFPEGLPGFERLKRFIMIEDADENSLFSYLQSTEDGNISFIMLDPYHLKADYRPTIQETYFEKLDGGADEDFTLRAIVNIPACVQQATVNLQAPLLFQTEKRKGIQVILEGEQYPIKYRLLASTAKAGEATC